MTFTRTTPLSPRMVAVTRLVLAVLPAAAAWVIWREVSDLRAQLALQRAVIILPPETGFMPALAVITWLLAVFILLCPTPLVATLPTRRPAMVAVTLVLGLAGAGVVLVTGHWAHGFMRSQGYARCPAYDRHVRTSRGNRTSEAWTLPGVCP